MEGTCSWNSLAKLTKKASGSEYTDELGYSVLNEVPVCSLVKVEHFLNCSTSTKSSSECYNNSKHDPTDDSGLNSSRQGLLECQSRIVKKIKGKSLPVNCARKVKTRSLFSCCVNRKDAEYEELKSESDTDESACCCTCLPRTLRTQKIKEHQYQPLMPAVTDKTTKSQRPTSMKEADLFSDSQFDTLRSKVLKSSKLEETYVGSYIGKTRMTSSEVCYKDMLHMRMSSTPITDMYSRDGRHKMYQAYMGQLNLCIEATSQKSIKIDILQACDLSLQPTQGSGFLVKVTMNGSSKKKLWQSEVVSNTNNPIYNRDFSFEVKRKDYNKRLVVSVYHYDVTLKTRKVIGCMSFGVQNLVQGKTVVNGWYYLLDGHLGQQKHMRAVDEQKTISTSTPIRRSTYSESESSGYTGSMSSTSFLMEDDPSVIDHIPDTNSTKPVEMHRIPIFKNQQGYGMTLHGGNPVHITKIQPGSPAATAGLQVGDQVFRINGQAVQTMYADTVGKIIRHYPRCVVLDVMRSSEKESDSVAVTTNFHLLSYMESELLDITTGDNK